MGAQSRNKFAKSNMSLWKSSDGWIGHRRNDVDDETAAKGVWAWDKGHLSHCKGHLLDYL